MLQHLEWEQLQHRRDKFHAITMYKMINNLVDINLSENHLHHIIALLEVTPFNLCNYMQIYLECYFFHMSWEFGTVYLLMLSATVDVFKVNSNKL